MPIALTCRSRRPEGGLVLDGVGLAKISMVDRESLGKLDKAGWQVVRLIGVRKDTRPDSPKEGTAFWDVSPVTREDLVSSSIETFVTQHGTLTEEAVAERVLRDTSDSGLRACYFALSSKTRRQAILAFWSLTQIDGGQLLSFMSKPVYSIPVNARYKGFRSLGRYGHGLPVNFSCRFNGSQWEVFQNNREVWSRVEGNHHPCQKHIDALNKQEVELIQIRSRHQEILQRHPLWQWFNALDQATKEAICSFGPLPKEVPANPVEFFCAFFDLILENGQAKNASLISLASGQPLPPKSA